MLLLTGKGVFISSLAGIFLGYFGYRTYDTLFTETRVKVDPRKPLGITIFTWKKTLFNGCKDNDNVDQGLKKLCKGTDYI